MPSFLLTERMDPKLRDRILASLKNDARARAGGENQRKSSFAFRLILGVSIACLATFLTLSFQKSRLEFQEKQRQLLALYKEQSAPFGSGFKTRMLKIDALLKTAHEPYEGDVKDQSLSDPRALDKILSERTIYVRGPLRGFLTERDRENAAGDSSADAMARCLSMVPSADSETALLRHLGAIYQPKAFRSHFSDLSRLMRSLHFIESDFPRQVQTAKHMKELFHLENRLQRIHLERAAKELDAHLFLLVLDEPKEVGAVSDFDGEAEHYLRLTLFDLKSDTTLLRVRRLVDPQWISDKSRSSYSRELDSCKLAYALRQELRPPPPQGRSPN